MIVTRFALPRALAVAVDRALHLASRRPRRRRASWPPAAGVVVACGCRARSVGQRLADGRDGRGDLRRQRAAVGVAQDDASRRPPRRPRAGSPARSRGRRGSRRRSARRRRRRACPAPTRKATESAIIAQVLLAVDAHDLLEVQRPGLADERAHRREAVGQHPQPLVVVGGRRRAGASSRRPTISACVERLAREQLEELQLLGVRRREAGLDQVDAERRRARARRAPSPRRRATCPRPACRRAGWCRRARRRAAHGVAAELTGDRVEPLAVALRRGRAARRRRRRCTARRDLAGPALADRVVVDLADGDELGGGAGHEDLVGQVQLGARDVALDDLEAEVARDLDRPSARLMPSRIDAVCGGVKIVAVADDEDVLARALADEAVVVEQDRLLVAGLVRLDLRQDAVEVLAAGLGVRDQRVGADAPPGGDLRADAVAACPPRRGRRPTPRRRSRRRPGRRAGTGPSCP